MSIQHRLEYAGFVAVSGLLRALPHRFAGRLGRAGGLLFYGLSRFRRTLAQENVRRALPELSERQVRATARESFEHHGAMILEGASLDRLADSDVDNLFEIEGLEHLEQLAESGQGFFIFSGHFGGVEQAIWALTRKLGHLHLVLKAQANPLMTERIRQIRAESDNTLIYAKTAGLRMLKAIKKGARICLLIDQRVQPRLGALLPFLGRPAWSSIGQARISTLTGCPAVPVYCTPLEGGRFRLEIEPPIVPEGRGVDIELALTQRYNDSLEARIRQRPELWFWMHSRWRLTVRHRWPHVRAKLLKESSVPPGEGVDGFAEERPPEAARKELARLRKEEFLEACETVTLTGPTGSGKTRTAAVLVEALAGVGHPSRYSGAAVLLDDLIDQRREGKLAEAWKKLDMIELLALDDIDRLTSEARTSMLLTLLRQRHNRRSTLVTSRLHPTEWESLVADPAQAAELRHLLASPGSTLELTAPEES